MMNLRQGWLWLAVLLLVSWAGIGSAQEPGVLVTIAGGGDREEEQMPAVELLLQTPFDAELDSAGNFYVADTFNHRVRKVDAATGLAVTVAGTGVAGFSGDDGPATSAQLNEPHGLSLDSAGNLYIADSANGRIRRVDAITGTITTIAGTGDRGNAGDGGLASEATFDEIVDLQVDGDGGLFLAEGIGASQRGENHLVRRIDFASGIVERFAGSGSAIYSGDDGPATEAGFSPQGLALDAEGNLYIADFNNHRIRRVARTTATITTVAGRGAANPITLEGGYGGDGGPATLAQLNVPFGIAVDDAGNLYLADTGNHRVRMVEAETGVILTVAGNGRVGLVGEGGLGLESELNLPVRVQVEPGGDLLIVDTENNRIRRLVDPSFRTPIFDLFQTALDFREVSVGDPKTLFLDVSNDGNATLTITDATVDVPDFAVTSPLPAEIPPFESVQVAVQLNPIREGGLEGLLTLSSDDPRRPTSTVILRGAGLFPDIGVTPLELDFPRTFVGSEASGELLVSNLGAGVLVVDRAILSDTTQFAVGLTDFLRVTSGQVASLSVTFRPTRPDTQRAALTLFSNDPDEPGVLINLSGVPRVPKPGGFADAGESVGMGDSGAGFGAAWGDFDGDDDPDLYLVRSLSPNLLYRNDGGAFTEVGSDLGVDDNGDGSAAAWADYDGDEDLDLYLTNFGTPNRLFRNDGSAFVDVASAAGVADEGDGYGAAWADYNRDGYPDLYLANFGRNRFFRNDAGTFTEIAGDLGLADSNSSVQPVWGDFDNDRDPDLFLANSGANRFFRNDGGTFTDITDQTGLTENGPSTGAAWGDYDNDGDLDLYVVYFGERNRLYSNEGGFFRELGLGLAVNDPGRGRGVAWADFDNDGDLDLYVTNSGEPNLLFRNDEDRFRQVAEELGVDVDADSRGVAVADFDGEGGLDLYVAIQDGTDRIYRNQEANGNWFVVRPRATQSSRDGIGARFEISYSGRRAIREVSGGSSYLSYDALSVAFGVGDAELVDTLTVRWPLGIVQRLFDIPVNQALEMIETVPLPPVRILLQPRSSSLVATGDAEVEILAAVLNEQEETVLLSGLPITFKKEFGSGNFLGPRTVNLQDGLASTRFRAGQTPGTVHITARAVGIEEQLTIDLIPRVETEQATLTTVSGVGFGFSPPGDGVPATEARMRLPRAVAVDSVGNLYIADTQSNLIRVVDAQSGIISTIAGEELVTVSDGDGGPASDARVADPRGLALLPNGDLLIAEQGGQVVRRVVALSDTIVAFAGRGVSGFGGDDGPAEAANLSSPVGLFADPGGSVWIADQFNHRIRRVNPEGVITTVAGSIQQGDAGDGGPATQARLNRPHSVVADSLGRIFIADTQNHKVRMVDEFGTITTVAGTGDPGFSGDGGPGFLANLAAPRSLALDRQGHLYIADTDNHVIRVLDVERGLIQTVAGTRTSGFNGDLGFASEISLDTPSGLFAAPDGRVYIADSGNHRIRVLTIEFRGLLPGLPPGGEAVDFNDDGQLDFFDFILFAGAFGSMDTRFDLDGDGFVGFGDLIQFASFFELTSGFASSYRGRSLK